MPEPSTDAAAPGAAGERWLDVARPPVVSRRVLRAACDAVAPPPRRRDRAALDALRDAIDASSDDARADALRRARRGLAALGRDDPARLVALLEAWAHDASPARGALVRAVLGGLVARGEPHALAAIGFGDAPRIEVAATVLREAPGGAVARIEVEFGLRATGDAAQRLLVDLVATRGDARPRRARVDALTLAPREMATMRARVGVPSGTGPVVVDARVNGRRWPLGTIATVIAR